MSITRTRLGLIGTAIAALVAPLTLAVLATPAEAAADRRSHHVTTYRLEKVIELEGGEQVETKLSCRAGDFAVDGTWRVDNVDDPNPQLGMFGDERDVLALASYGDADPRHWLFRLRNGADGRAQLKVFVVCLDDRTVKQWGHLHKLSIGKRMHVNLPNIDVGDEQFNSTDLCGTGKILVAPGFSIKNGTARNYRSWPTPSLKGWRWAFISNDASTDVTVYARCLDVKTSESKGHRHDITSYLTHGSAGSLEGLPVSTRYERQLTCDNHFWGAVGAWWVHKPDEVWHLGSDPRPITRAHFFWSEVNNSPSYLTLRCLGKRTSHGFS